MFRSSHWRCSVEKDVLRNFTKFIGKHLCQRLIFNKVAGLRPVTLLKKSLRHSCLSVNFVKFLRIPFSTKHLWWLLLYVCKKRVFINSKITQSQCFCKLVNVGKSNCEIDINQNLTTATCSTFGVKFWSHTLNIVISFSKKNTRFDIDLIFKSSLFVVSKSQNISVTIPLYNCRKDCHVTTQYVSKRSS